MNGISFYKEEIRDCNDKQLLKEKKQEWKNRQEEDA